MIVAGAEAGYWVAERVGAFFHPDAMTALAWRATDGELTQGVFYRDWNGVSVEATIAADKPLVRTFVQAIFDYPFCQIGARMIVVSVQQCNNRSLNLMARLGFQILARLPDACPSGDIIIAALRRADCRFLGGLHGKKCLSPARA